MSIRGARLKCIEISWQVRFFERLKISLSKLGKGLYSENKWGSSLTVKESVENSMRYSDFEFLVVSPYTTNNLVTTPDIQNTIGAAYSTPIGVPKASLVCPDMLWIERDMPISEFWGYWGGARTLTFVPLQISQNELREVVPLIKPSQMKLRFTQIQWELKEKFAFLHF